MSDCRKCQGAGFVITGWIRHRIRPCIDCMSRAPIEESRPQPRTASRRTRREIKRLNEVIVGYKQEISNLNNGYTQLGNMLAKKDRTIKELQAKLGKVEAAEFSKKFHEQTVEMNGVANHA